jgi:hypothetical protein
LYKYVVLVQDSLNKSIFKNQIFKEFIYYLFIFFLIAEAENCTKRSVDEFQGNFMTLEETRNGGVFAHILIVLYVFGALAIVCDDYFCASLEIICDGKILM